MDTQIMLKQMCKSDITESDIKAICKSRGFPAKEAASRDAFENFFISTIGIKEVLDSLTHEEIVFLHLLNKMNKRVNIEYFERLYGSTRPKKGYYYGTFNQLYNETFKKVKKNLVQKGVLIIIEKEPSPYIKSTKLERLRFYFPVEFSIFLPPVFKAYEFTETGNIKRNIMRNKLLEVIGKKQKTSHLSNPRSYTLVLKDGDLFMGDEKFKVSRLLKWQQACWHASVKEITRIESDKMTPIEVTLYALSQLKEHEWLPADDLDVILKIFTGVMEDLPSEQICDVGWEWGCLEKAVVDKKAYYRLPDDPLETTLLSPDKYLSVEPDGSVVIDMLNVPYTAIEVLASVADLNVAGSGLQATANFIKIGNAFIKVKKESVFEWLKNNSSGFRSATEKAEKKWGKQIIHENLMIARIKDLSLKVKIENSFADSQELVTLPDDHIAFPSDFLPAIQKLVNTSGHVIKKGG